tara:strand:+ start:236 stop:655 length:420 start_codon:yes stop_codon:yes gene_type:complete
MIVLSTALLAIISILLIIWPIVKSKMYVVGKSVMLVSLDDSMNRERQCYEEIRVAISDHQLGNITNQEYIYIIDKRRMEAALALMERHDILKSIRYMVNHIEDTVSNIRRMNGTLGELEECDKCKGLGEISAPICFRCF